MAYVIWMLLLLFAMAAVPVANPEQFQGQPLVLMVILCVSAVICGLIGTDPAHRTYRH